METFTETDTVDKLLFHVQQLINNSPDAGENKIHIDALVKLFSSISSISALSDMNESKDANLNSGVAISPVQAARCLQEILRSQIFLQGVHHAINDKLKQHDHINILYAGTGPYGLLLLPLLAIFKNTRISATLIDIHPQNIDSIKNVSHALQISDYIKQIEIADATQWQPSNGECFDIIISETMSTLLRREPQLTIFTHLQQFLKPDGHLIPENIIISAALINNANEQALKESGKDDTPAFDLGVLFQCDKESTKRIYQGDLSPLSGEISLPEKFDQHKYRSVKFMTTIDVYGKHRLGENQCSLNIPLYYGDMRLETGKSIDFEYQLTDHPEFVFDFPTVTLNTEPATIEETGKLKIMHAKRLWHKSQLQRINRLDNTIIEKEWPLDMLFLDTLKIPLHDAISYLYQEQPDFPMFEQWLRETAAAEVVNNPANLNSILLEKHAQLHS